MNNTTFVGLLDGDWHSYLPTWVMDYVVMLISFYDETTEYISVALIAVVYYLIFFSVIGALTYCFLTLTPKSRAITEKRVLFVTAHPDDECMFFGPTILRLKEFCDVHLLCLSIGDHNKKGFERKKELWKSCQVLGIPMSNIMLMNNTRMPDDPSRKWSAVKSSKLLLEYIECYNFEEVYTFDIGGVSGHLNHTSVYYGFARLCLKKLLPPYCKVYLLDSVNVIRKYSLFLDSGLSKILSNHIFMVSVKESNIIRKAMRKHRTQQAWYRWMYIYSSRYLYMNTYKELEIEDVELVIQMADYSPLL